MEEIVKIAAIGICGGILIAVLKNRQSEFVIPVMLASGVVIIFSILDYISSANLQILQIAAEYGVDTGYIKIIIKVISIAYVCQFASELLKDSDMGSVASKVELAGRLVIFSYVFPIARALLGQVLKVLDYL